ncbi:MAG: hypothetical protein ACO1N1_04725 [Dyadobacter fermentans]
MRTEKWLVRCVALLLIQLVACERGKMEENAPAPVSARTGADSMGLDSIPKDTIRNDSIYGDTIIRDTVVRDTIVRDTIVRDTVVWDSIIRDSVVKNKSLLNKPNARARKVASGALERLKTVGRN